MRALDVDPVVRSWLERHVSHSILHLTAVIWKQLSQGSRLFINILFVPVKVQTLKPQTSWPLWHFTSTLDHLSSAWAKSCQRPLDPLNRVPTDIRHVNNRQLSLSYVQHHVNLLIFVKNVPLISDNVFVCKLRGTAFVLTFNKVCFFCK